MPNPIVAKKISRRDFMKQSAMGIAASTLVGLNTRPILAETNENLLDCVIIGGGISGLTAAYLMQSKNILVLEKDKRLGGRVCSGEWEGFHYAKGAEYMGEPEDEMAEWFQDLGINTICVPPPSGAVAAKGRVYSGKHILDFLPGNIAFDDYTRLGRMLNDLNEKGIEEALYEDVQAMQPFRELDRITVQSWMQKENFHSTVQHLVNIENRGLFGAANEDLSFLYNIPEMAFNLRDPQEAESSSVYTFSKGIVEIIWAIEKQLTGKIHTGCDVTQVRVDSDKTVLITFKEKDKEKTLRSRTAVLATLATVTAAIVSSGFSDKVLSTLSAIQYTPYVTLNLFLSERVWKAAWSMACIDDTFVTLYDAIRTQVPIEYANKAILGVYIPPKNAKDTWLMEHTDSEILEETLSDLEKYDPNIRDKVIGYDLHRIPYAFPVFCPNYINTLTNLTYDDSTHGPLFLAGDYMVYATLDGAASSGVNASERVSKYLQ